MKKPSKVASDPPPTSPFFATLPPAEIKNFDSTFDFLDFESRKNFGLRPRGGYKMCHEVSKCGHGASYASQNRAIIYGILTSLMSIVGWKSEKSAFGHVEGVLRISECNNILMFH